MVKSLEFLKKAKVQKVACANGKGINQTSTMTHNPSQNRCIRKSDANKNRKPSNMERKREPEIMSGAKQQQQQNR